MSATERELLLRAGLTPGRDLPDLVQGRHAAVAIILADSGLDILFIKRPVHPKDPWSGQVALPGGRYETIDPHLEATARRETAEEVGIALIDEHWWGALSPIQANVRVSVQPMWVSPHVYRVPGPAPAFRLKSDEAAAARWISIEQLLDPRHQTRIELPRDGMTMKFPAWQVDDFTIWGLTYFMVRTLLRPLLKNAPTSP